MGRPFVAPPGTPPAIVATLRAAFNTAMKDPELLAVAKKLDLEVAPMTGEDVQTLVQRLHNFPKSVIERTQAITNAEM
jgi:tripartite-type tricarboxylate transporter receptor subunit TctC